METQIHSKITSLTALPENFEDLDDFLAEIDSFLDRDEFPDTIFVERKSSTSDIEQALENAVKSTDEVHLKCDYTGCNKTYTTIARLTHHIKHVHVPAPQLTETQLSGIIQQSKQALFDKVEEGLYDSSVKNAIEGMQHNSPQLLASVNSALKEFRDLVVAKHHMMVILPKFFFDINSIYAQLFVQNLCHMILFELKKTNVTLVGEFQEALTDNEKKVLAYISGHCFQKKYKRIIRISRNKPSLKHHLDILGAPKIEESSNSLYNLVNAKNRTGALWLVSEDTVAMFEHIELKLRALFNQDPRKISDKKLSISFLHDSCVRSLVDFLQEKTCLATDLCEEVLCQVISLFIRIRIYRHLKHLNNKIAPSTKALRNELKNL